MGSFGFQGENRLGPWGRFTKKSNKNTGFSINKLIKEMLLDMCAYLVWPLRLGDWLRA